MKHVRRQLADGLLALNVAATEKQMEQLLHFLFLLEKWNRVYNLTSVSAPEQAVGLHLLDSLAVSPHLSGSRILDVGTGAGLPGIPLAIFHDAFEFTLLDSNAKKTRFVQQAILELGLTHVEVATCRVDDYSASTPFDTILTRAWASLAIIWQETGRLLASGGRVLALKGQHPVAELAALRDCRHDTYRLHVPGLDAERHLIQIMKD